MVRPIPLLCLIMIVSAVPQAIANEWSFDLDQGFREARIRVGSGTELSIACGIDDGRAGSIQVTVAGEAPAAGERIVWQFDDAAEQFSTRLGQDRRLTTGCPDCDAAFRAVVIALKRYSTASVTFQNGATATFPLSGSTWAIGECQIEDTLPSASAPQTQPVSEEPASTKPDPAPAIEPAAQPEPATADPGPASDGIELVEIFRLDTCNAERGVGLIGYFGSGTDDHVLTDICFNAETGAFRSYEDIDGFKLVIDDGGFTNFETTEMTTSGERETIYFSPVDIHHYFPELDPARAAARLVSWGSAGGVADGRTLKKPGVFLAHITPGYFGGQSFNGDLRDGNYRVHAEIAFSADADYPAEYAPEINAKVFPITGQLRATAGALTGEIGAMGMTVDISLRHDKGGLAGAIKVTGVNPRIDGYQKEDWTELEIEAAQMLGRVVGASGDELYLIAPRQFTHTSYGGAEHRMWMIVSLFALRAE